MNAAERRDRIVEYLRIKPISHGQVYTFQIAVPESEVVEIPYGRHDYLRKSLTGKGTNLIPLIVRRTEAYSEEEEYEVVYGADWCLVAKELDIEKLWVWVFDMTDDQAATAKEEMQQLVGSSDSIPVAVQPASEETETIKTVIQKLDKLFQPVETLNKKIEQVTVSIKKLEERESKQTATYDKLVQQVPDAVRTIIAEMHQQLATLNQKVEQVTESFKKLEESQSKPIATDDKLVQQVPEAVRTIVEEVLSKGNQTPQTDLTDYSSKKKDELKELAKQRGIKVTTSMTKDAIIKALKQVEKS